MQLNQVQYVFTNMRLFRPYLPQKCAFVKILELVYHAFHIPDINLPQEAF